MHSPLEELYLSLSVRLLALIRQHGRRVHHDQPPPTPWVATRPRARWARYNANPRPHGLACSGQQSGRRDSARAANARSVSAQGLTRHDRSRTGHTRGARTKYPAQLRCRKRTSHHSRHSATGALGWRAPCRRLLGICALREATVSLIERSHYQWNPSQSTRGRFDPLATTRLPELPQARARRRANSEIYRAGVQTVSIRDAP